MATGPTGAQLASWTDGLALNRKHWALWGICTAGFMFDLFDLQILAFIAPRLLKEWNLTPPVLGTIISAAFLGMLVGTYIFGTVSDYIGRRPGFQITVGIFAVFSGLCAAAQNVFQLVALRFCVGLGTGGFIPVDTAVLAEYMPARKRGQMIALAAIGIPLGGLLAAWVASIVIPNLGWRALFLVGVVPAIMILVFRWFVPETPRFLLSKGRLAEAERSARWIADGAEPPAAVSGETVTATAKPAPTPSPIPELFSPTYRRRTVLAWSIWFGWNFSYFGLILWLPTLLGQYLKVPAATVFTYIMGFQVSGIVGRLVMLSLVDRVGRRPIIIGCGVCAGALLLVFGAQTEMTWLIVFGYALAFFHDGGFSGVAPYTPELYPTHARSTGVGWANGAGRIGATIAPIVVGFLIAAEGTYAVFVVFAAAYFAVALIVVLIGVETKGKLLEEAALDVVAAKT